MSAVQPAGLARTLPKPGHFPGALARTTCSGEGSAKRNPWVGSGTAAGQCKEIRHSARLTGSWAPKRFRPRPIAGALCRPGGAGFRRPGKRPASSVRRGFTVAGMSAGREQSSDQLGSQSKPPTSQPRLFTRPRVRSRFFPASADAALFVIEATRCLARHYHSAVARKCCHAGSTSRSRE